MVVVVYRKTERSNIKHMIVFTEEKTPDLIIDSSLKKQILPKEYVIEEIGIGKKFIDLYKKLYKIKKHATI